MEKRTFWERVGQEYIGFGGKTNYRTETIDLEFGGSTFDDLRTFMGEIEKEYGDRYREFRIESSQKYMPYDPDPSWVTEVFGFREETDEELAKREAEKAQREADKRAQELKKLEELKAKYGE